MFLFILVIAVTMGLSFLAMSMLKSTYNKYLQIGTQGGLTGADVAQRILDAADIHDVEIVPTQGDLSDHYDLINKRLVLSEKNYYGNSISSIGVSAHECGHAVQHKAAYAPLQWRMASVWSVNFANPALMWIGIIGMMLGFLAPFTGTMLIAAGMGIVMLFQLITLPVEFDASRRAKIILGKMNLVTPEEGQGVAKVLNAAAMTYVAAFVSSLLWLLYYLLPLLLGSRD